MQLKSLSITNVKSFRETTLVTFDGSLNILVGPNGGGKSNLLDTITTVLHHFFLPGWVEGQSSDQYGTFKNVGRSNLFEPVLSHLQPFIGNTSPMGIEVTFTVRDSDKISMQTINDQLSAMGKELVKFRNGSQFEVDALRPYNLALFEVSPADMVYRILSGALDQGSLTDASREYLRYLNHHELYVLLGQEVGLVVPAEYLYFSPIRGAGSATSFEANLSQANPSDLRRAYLGATSRANTSLIQLATLRFGAKRRMLEKNAANEGFEKKWADDGEVKAITRYLARVGYSWSLDPVDPLRNIYRIVLHRDGTKFDISQASTGEQEIINYLIGLFAFGLNGGLLIIDEAELHLHPKWQVLLLDLLTELAITTNNQILISTHSPAFITPRSVRNVIRVFRDDKKTSRIRRLEGDEATTRDMLHVVNSHNNERMFFADVVVLVEGIMDRLVFAMLIERGMQTQNSTRIIEVLEVHGKTNFDRYRQFLENFGVEVRIVADQDFLLDIGDSNVKELFVTDWSAIDKKTLNDKKSIDRSTLAEVLENAITSKDLTTLDLLWKYIKSRRSALKTPLSAGEAKTVDAFINDRRAVGVFVLRRGEIEDYLPEGRRNVEGVIALTEDVAFTAWLAEAKESEGTKELVAIAEAIIGAVPAASKATAKLAPSS
jgi:predicted ATPase